MLGSHVLVMPQIVRHVLIQQVLPHTSEWRDRDRDRDRDRERDRHRERAREIFSSQRLQPSERELWEKAQSLRGGNSRFACREPETAEVLGAPPGRCRRPPTSCAALVLRSPDFLHSWPFPDSFSIASCPLLKRPFRRQNSRANQFKPGCPVSPQVAGACEPAKGSQKQQGQRRAAPASGHSEADELMSDPRVA